MGLEYLLVRVKENSNDDYKEYRGIDLIAIRIDKDKKPMILRPIKIDEIEKFYKASYDSGMKDMISDDYEYCVWYLADEDCELQCSIEIDQIDIIRNITKEDFEEHNRNFDEFKRIHKFAEREQAMKEQEEKERIAVEEFKKLDKVDFFVRVRDGGESKVKAIIYKGFAIHDSLDSVNAEDSEYKAITVAEGKHKGIKLLSCNVTEYKKCIDEIREAIGDKQLEESDSSKLRDIVKKY